MDGYLAGPPAQPPTPTPIPMFESEARDWTIVLVLTALSLSIVVLVQTLATYVSAYVAAPREATVFLDTVEFSIQENENYDRDVEKVQQLGDKVRLGRLLREIQKGSDDLREELGRLLVSEDAATLRTSARILWASKKRVLEDRARRLDQLRMRFLVVYMGVLTAGAAKSLLTTTPVKDPEKSTPPFSGAEDGSPRTPLAKVLTDPFTKRPPLRRLTTQAIGHNNDTGGPHKKGWFGVVQELQKSPKMQQRHASIEGAMKTPSPISHSSVLLHKMIAPTDDVPSEPPP
ncbi:uncharacterized protein DNG_00811 [Cephalotrichum gorgonifer]|uniref:Transmembrane protein n=1 Tax=Cephalotrichum gorgonifer TaxID=2041049 RepID=A0AAE8MPS0_9PEZI|nr:uncharacterized protein DNG_00811 [Cephalotrichum gorgonifer]